MPPPPTLHPIARDSANYRGYLANHHGWRARHEKGGACLDTPARAQLRAAHQRQTVLRYCTVYGVDLKMKIEIKLYQTAKFPPPPTLRSIARGSTRSRGYLANHDGWRARHEKGVLTLTHEQRLSYAQRTNDNPFCDTAVRSLV